MISEPPEYGAVQSILTESVIKVVVGAFGYPGTYAARIVTTLEYALNPKLFLA